jgi:hypothetical protein
MFENDYSYYTAIEGLKELWKLPEQPTEADPS